MVVLNVVIVALIVDAAAVLPFLPDRHPAAGSVCCWCRP
jgi:hypothetical protein